MKGELTVVADEDTSISCWGTAKEWSMRAVRATAAAATVWRRSPAFSDGAVRYHCLLGAYPNELQTAEDTWSLDKGNKHLLLLLRL